MNILRLAWSSYQSDESLRREQNAIEAAGFSYERAEDSGVFPDQSGPFDLIIINSQYSVTEDRLANWGPPDTVITASSGYDQIDLEACQAAGVRVVRTPLARAHRVVQHTDALIQALLRDLPRGNHGLREGDWTRKQSFYRVQRLSSLTVGVLGFGVIGENVANRMVKEGAYRVVAHDPEKQGTIESTEGVDYLPLSDFIDESQLLTVHLDGRTENNNVLDGEIFQSMPDPSYLVNTARGSVVAFGEMLRALEDGALAGAAIDVFPEEPPETMDDDLPDTLIMTPHTAGFGPGLLPDLTDEILKAIESIDQGQQPAHTVV